MNTSSEKENLVLVHSFPTNSVLLDGLIDYLGNHFNLHFIDLPGFTSDIPYQDEEVTFEHFSSYVESEIDSLEWDEYIVGGISFGFLVVNNASLDKDKCKAIVAVEPYLQSEYLHLGFIKRFLYTHLINEILNYDLSKILWNSEIMEDVLVYLAGQSEERIDIILDEIDGDVFFNTAKMLIENEEQPEFKDLPYVLLINDDDETIMADKIIDEFKENVGTLLVLPTDMDHYPEEISESYFQHHLPKAKIDKLTQWINEPN